MPPLSSTFPRDITNYSYRSPNNQAPRGQTSTFTSADTFLDLFPGGLPAGIDTSNFGFGNVSGFTAESNALRQRAIPFSQLLEESGLAGTLQRAEDRFPDFEAFRQERLGGIAAQARAATSQLRQTSAGEFFGPGPGSARSQELQFLANIGTANQASAIENAVEEGRRAQAEFLGQLDLDVGRERSLLARTSASDQLGRDIQANLSFIEGQGFASAGKDRVAGLEQFNRTFPLDFARTAAGFTALDQASAAGQAQGGFGNQLFQAQIDSRRASEAASILANIRENLPQFDSQFPELIAFLEAQSKAGESGGGFLNFEF